MKVVEVAAAIAARQAAEGARAQRVREGIIAEIYGCAFANVADYVRVNTDGYPVVDFSNVSREQMAAVASIKLDEYVEGAGRRAREVKRVSFRLVDKMTALVTLSKLLGFWKERVEHSGRLTLEDIAEASRSPELVERGRLTALSPAALVAECKCLHRGRCASLDEHAEKIAASAQAVWHEALRVAATPEGTQA